MRIFLHRLTYISIITLLSFGTLRIFILNNSKKNYNSDFIYKLELLNKYKNNKKGVLIGGSSVGWGLSAKILEDSLGIKFINLGHHAGFGIVDYLPFIRSCLNPSDIIIFSPEYSFYHNPTKSSGALVDLYTNNIKYGFITKNYSHIISAFLFTKFNNFSNKPENPNQPYHFQSINDNGDVISHYSLKPTGPSSLDINKFYIDSFLSVYKSLLTRKNCYLLYPPTQQTTYEKKSRELKKLHAILKDRINVVNTIEDNVFSDSAYFNAEYHLTKEANFRRTQELLTFLRKKQIHMSQ